MRRAQPLGPLSPQSQSVTAHIAYRDHNSQGALSWFRLLIPNQLRSTFLNLNERMDINTRKDGCRFETWSYRRKEWKERPLFVNYFLIVTFIDIQISHFNMYATEKSQTAANSFIYDAISLFSFNSTCLGINSYVSFFIALASLFSWKYKEIDYGSISIKIRWRGYIFGAWCALDNCFRLLLLSL